MKTLDLTPNTTLDDVDKQFRVQFPYLKLVFFQQAPDLLLNIHHLHDQIKNKTIREFNNETEPFHLELNAEIETGVFEKQLSNLLNINVQIFRKSGVDKWIETSQTDFWTLEKQNEDGKSSSGLN